MQQAWSSSGSGRTRQTFFVFVAAVSLALLLVLFLEGYASPSKSSSPTAFHSREKEVFVIADERPSPSPKQPNKKAATISQPRGKDVFVIADERPSSSPKQPNKKAVTVSQPRVKEVSVLASERYLYSPSPTQEVTDAALHPRVKDVSVIADEHRSPSSKQPNKEAFAVSQSRGKEVSVLASERPSSSPKQAALSLYEEAVTASQPRGKEIFVFGKLAERRVEDRGGDIYVSIKSTAKNHKKRVAYSMLTWLQTVKPEQVHVVTDNVTDNDKIYQAAKEMGMSFIPTECPNSHEPVSLCCKAGEEYLNYYCEKAEGKSYKWFCHFDDDMYINIPNLLLALGKTGNSSDNGVYFGRWPGWIVKGKLKEGIKIPEDRLHKVGIHDFDRSKLKVKWGTGAAYCISASLMDKLEKYFQGNHTYYEYCDVIGLNDDLVPAVLAATLGYTITDHTGIKCQYEALGKFSEDKLRDMLTISFRGRNVVKIKSYIFPRKVDPTRFLAYHCLLYPSTNWCKRSAYSYISHALNLVKSTSV